VLRSWSCWTVEATVVAMGQSMWDEARIERADLDALRTAWGRGLLFEIDVVKQAAHEASRLIRKPEQIYDTA
jgi:hypothetical protein